MPKSIYDNDEINVPQPEETSAEGASGATAEVPDGLDEEFDISSFDFTIADPGEIAEFSAPATPEERAPSEESVPVPEAKKKKEKFSLGKLSSALSEKAAKLMEETPKEPKVREKKEKPPKAPRNKETAVLPEEPVAPPRQKISFRVSRGSIPQIARRWMRYALRPATLYQNLPEWMWPAFLLGVALFFGGFYLTIGLDWYFADLVSMGRLWALVGIGLLVGGTAALAFAAGTQGLSLLCRKESIRPFRVISTVAGACVYPALFLIPGLLIQLIFKASVSMSFGVMAVLWMMYVLLDVLRDMFGEKNLFKSTIMIVLWGFLLFIMMSLTFTLK